MHSDCQSRPRWVNVDELSFAATSSEGMTGTTCEVVRSPSRTIACSCYAACCAQVEKSARSGATVIELPSTCDAPFVFKLRFACGTSARAATTPDSDRKTSSTRTETHPESRVYLVFLWRLLASTFGVPRNTPGPRKHASRRAHHRWLQSVQLHGPSARFANVGTQLYHAHSIVSISTAQLSNTMTWRRSF